jgi:FAD/FMN-containing dehydrogenase
LKLFPRPRSRAVAFVGLDDPGKAQAMLNFMKDHIGPGLQAFELIPRVGLEMALCCITGARDPLAIAHPWYALIEIAGFAEGEAERAMGAALTGALEAGLARDAAIAQSLDQAESLWRLRENLSEAQKRDGGSIKHDISVPIERIPAFIAEAGARVAAHFPQARPVPFGHMGDGNLHYNVSQPIGADKAAFLARWDEMNEIVHGLVQEYGGSISAEHGIGQLKRDLLARVKDPVALDVMRSLKKTLDPRGVLNPGKLL